MGRAGEPAEIATSYVFLASEDSSYFTGQTLHPNGTSSCTFKKIPWHKLLIWMI